MRSKILIYEDYGCSDVSSLLNRLKEYFEPRGYQVDLTDAGRILKESALNEDVFAFFMPGGAGTPYRQKLQAQGNALIRRYVEQGGIYYGICAGAYYACEHTIFEKDIPELRVIEAYGLDLIRGNAIGTLYKELNLKPFNNTIYSSAVVDIVWRDGKRYRALYHGGPYFDVPEMQDVEILAYYDAPVQRPAIIKRNMGQGKVIISGVHYENTGRDLFKVIQTQRYKDSQSVAIAQQLSFSEEKRRALFDRVMDLSRRG